MPPTSVLTTNKVELAGERLPIRRIGLKRLKSVSFSVEGRKYMAIEQNAEKPSRWGRSRRGAQEVHCGRHGRTGERVRCNGWSD
jgi:hypothetical protein